MMLQCEPPFASARRFFLSELYQHLGKELIISSEPRINDRIRVPEVRLIGAEGEQLGVVPTGEALHSAEEAGLDLVEVAPQARPPVAKLMDYGKYKYEAAMKERDARRKQANSQIKEIRFRLKIDDHDFETKKGHVERFLKSGDKVKVMIMFRGREQSRPEMGVKLLQRLAEDVSELATVEMMPRQDGRNMVMVLAPTRKKQRTKSEQRRQREGERPKKVNRQQLKDERKRRRAEEAAKAAQEAEG
ncbi:MAG: translation initiation factor IF-3 [Actinomycetaceae bacterium]|nr:translation initiation factor IF-3 [Actinomycetaceae bacterium]